MNVKTEEVPWHISNGGSQSQTNGTRHFGGTEPRGIGTFFFFLRGLTYACANASAGQN